MFTVRANGTQYSMSFEQRNVKRLTKGGFEDVVETVCRINIQEAITVAVGTAQRSPLDPEDTPKALEISMKRALEGVWFEDKNEQRRFRGAFWDALRTAIWETFKPEESEALKLEISVPDVIDAEPDEELDTTRVLEFNKFEPETVLRARAALAFAEGNHLKGTMNDFLDTHDCRYCNKLRDDLKQALANTQ